MDRISHEALTMLELPDVHAIALADYERDDKALLEAKQNRTLIEYYFTCSPSLPLFILDNHRDVDLITYLDADLFFFADPTPVFDELGDRSIGIIGHRFPASLRGLERFGVYNVGWLSFRRNAQALACLHWWRERCLEWCSIDTKMGASPIRSILTTGPSDFRASPSCNTRAPIWPPGIWRDTRCQRMATTSWSMSGRSSSSIFTGSGKSRDVSTILA
jgi:hypothetical protein